MRYPDSRPCKGIEEGSSKVYVLKIGYIGSLNRAKRNYFSDMLKHPHSFLKINILCVLIGLFGCALNDNIDSDGACRSYSLKYPDKKIEYDEMVDSRDGKIYKTVKIGQNVWMAQNLDLETPGSYCYDNKPENCEKYGRLYLWSAAMDSAAIFSNQGIGCGNGVLCGEHEYVQGVCPKGRHLPTEKEQYELMETVSAWARNWNGYTLWCHGNKSLKASSGWNMSDSTNANGLDQFGFSALPAGIYLSTIDKFQYAGQEVDFWSSGYSGIYNASCLTIEERDNAIISGCYRADAVSVRCVRS